ncbi:MAG: ribosome maturation factor RimM [Actinomycetota bacterium]|nr:ribosome maturation factor RimM [Actinomycetota bacterium]
MTPPGMLLAGEIGKPHGTAGDVYVVRISDDPNRFDPGAVLTHEDGRELVVESSRVHRDRFLVRFEGVATREQAEALRGPLYVPAEARRELEESEYWEQDLVGCTVELADGNEVGTVSDVIVRPAQDLLEVDTPAGTRFVPFVQAIVKEVDLDARRVLVDPPAGLFD